MIPRYMILKQMIDNAGMCREESRGRRFGRCCRLPGGVRLHSSTSAPDVGLVLGHARRI